MKKSVYKKWAAAAIALLILIFSAWNSVLAEEGEYTYPTPPEVISETAVLIEAETGQILYGKSEHKRMEPASLTKIMTCLLAVELWNGDEEDMVEVTPDVLYDIDYMSSTMELMIDEVLPMPDMLYGLMLPSANDAANAVAIHFEEEVYNFVSLMNSRVKKMGLTGTNFSNPHGLPADDHYSTAYDMAMITREAVKDERFLRFAGAAEHYIPANSESEERNLEHASKLLRPDSDQYYPGVIAGKTGWTRRAGHCLMTAAQRDGMTLICVVMRAGSAANEYADTTALFNYGFENFKKVNIDCTPYDNTQIDFVGRDGKNYKAILSLRERKFTAVVPKDAQGDMMVFSLPNAADIKDGAYADALLGWSDKVSGAPSRPIRTVQVRVWVDEAKEATANASEIKADTEVKTQTKNLPAVIGCVVGAAALGGIVWVKKRTG